MTTTDALGLADEIQLLVNEYDPINSDWSFRKGVISSLIGRLRSSPSAVREALDHEEKFLLDHFDADCGIMSGDVQGSFHRIRELLSPTPAVARGEETLKYADELHDLGFHGGWNAGLESSAAIADRRAADELAIFEQAGEDKALSDHGRNSIQDRALARNTLAETISREVRSLVQPALASSPVVGRAAVSEGYYGCSLPPGACHCSQGSRSKCSSAHWVPTPPSETKDAAVSRPHRATPGEGA